MSNLQIIPAILATTEEEYKDKITKLWDCNLFDRDWVQLDLMDGEFVKNKSVLPQIIKKYPASFKIEAQLMVNDPLLWAEQLKDFHQILRYIIPIEIAKARIDEFVAFVRSFSDAEIGFSFNPETSFSQLGEYQSLAESILIMGVHPGFGSQQFIPKTLEKVKQAAFLISSNNLDCLVGVDGGINATNAKQIVKAGADYLVVGSSLLQGNIDENLRKIQNAIGE